MIIELTWRNQPYTAELSKPIDIALPLIRGIENQPNAFAAPPYDAQPVVSGDFTGSIARGGPVNFFNIEVNPHGNGTHTECIGHILDGDHSIVATLDQTMFVAELISVFPTLIDNGDKCITRQTLEAMTCEETEALVVRTLPNSDEKRTRKYTGTNPAFFSGEAMAWIEARGTLHLLTDLPSIDPEIDGGALKAHKTFWRSDKNPHIDRTITEMVFVDNSVPDGLYLLDIQIGPFALDASPSRPLLYRMKPKE